MAKRKIDRVKASKTIIDASNTEVQANTFDSFPIVGIGASAGGLAAFEAFFSGMPADEEPGMAFVLVQHLAPDHKSILTELIQRYTRMKVFEVEDGMEVQPNCTYIIPPNRDMALMNGRLQLLETDVQRGLRLPIDFFFRSLAHDQHERAICIVLSGTGSDGTQGIQAVKSEGGMVMVQSPDSTEYDGMPLSAIGTGLVDYELQPSEMPACLMAYAAHAFHKPSASAAVSTPETENLIKRIFILLRTQTGHDFSKYKPNTVNRQIERRMAVHQVKTMFDYVKYLQQTPTEINTLFHSLLIGVTKFFRDPEAFKTIEEQVIPGLFADKPAGAPVRIWSPGCSTGEEAYSIAILLQERLEKMKQSYRLQVFATDIDGQAISTARTGLYPASIAADISSERLARFFSVESNGSMYRVNKGIRDMIVFSEQDIIKDPPFSKLDLLSCRNILIYMGRDLQKKVIPLFHYALNPGGFLFLGTSETIGEFGDLFALLDRKSKIYQRKEDIHSAHNTTLGRFIPYMTASNEISPQISGKAVFPLKLPLRELTEQALLQQVNLSGVLVNSQGDILYINGRTGMYLEPSPGETGISNVLKMAREGLRGELIKALQKAVMAKEIIRCPGLHVENNGGFITVNLIVRPMSAGTASMPEDLLYLIVLEEVPSLILMNNDQQSSGGDRSYDIDNHIAVLEQELHVKEEYLQTANEELKSSNEEMQSVNEELQSANEELETSKEELQSINEELATVNAELQIKVVDLSRANNDMNNLLAGSGIGTVFVDHQLRILRFTPAVTRIINLILTDVGRPVGHVVSNLIGYSRLIEDIRMVLDTLIPKEVEVQTTEDMWYTMRIQPYRTLENVIEGAVITFVDITDMKRTERKFKMFFNSVHDAVIIQDRASHIIDVNQGMLEMYNISYEQALKLTIKELSSPEMSMALVEEYWARVMRGESVRFGWKARRPYEEIFFDVEVIAGSLEINGLLNVFWNIRKVA